MNTHINNIESLIGSLKGKAILDIGAGFGDFVFACLERGYDARGIELNAKKIAKAEIAAAQKGISLPLVQGIAESLPFENNRFDFVNVGEVIEHVRDPRQVLKEIYRVLKPGGHVYVSVHNRFGMYDTHFHVYFLGWMPRAWTHAYLSILGRHKEYAKAVDFQNIRDMHYYSYNTFQKLAEEKGFRVQDIREIKLKRMPAWKKIVYPIFRSIYFSTFHVLLQKPMLLAHNGNTASR
ncbi:MAG TPA: class I SAM-dependent methyltransferase [Candidatus Paceibacterota bacterium]|nr:class I SAM-dependent methyltransferase [Candidatus Paceibacterota bacterium]